MVYPIFEYHNFIDFCTKYNADNDIVILHPPIRGDLPAPSFTVLYKNYPYPCLSLSVAELHKKCKNDMKLEWKFHASEILVNRGTEQLGAPLTIDIEMPKVNKDYIKLFVTLHYDTTASRNYCGVFICGLVGKGVIESAMTTNIEQGGIA